MQPSDVALHGAHARRRRVFHLSGGRAPEDEITLEPEPKNGEDTEIEAQIEQIAAEPYPISTSRAFLPRAGTRSRNNVRKQAKSDTRGAVGALRGNRVFPHSAACNPAKCPCVAVFRGSRDDAQADENISDVIDGLKNLLKDFEISGKLLAEKIQKTGAEKDPARARRFRSELDRLVSRRVEVLQSRCHILCATIFRRAHGNVSLRTREIREARARKRAFKDNFIVRMASLRRGSNRFARDFDRCVENFQKARENLVLANQRLVIFFAANTRIRAWNWRISSARATSGFCARWNVSIRPRGRAWPRMPPGGSAHAHRAVSCQGATIGFLGMCARKKTAFCGDERNDAG
jgi:hypothetical protein